MVQLLVQPHAPNSFVATTTAVAVAVAVAGTGIEKGAGGALTSSMSLVRPLSSNNAGTAAPKTVASTVTSATSTTAAAVINGATSMTTQVGAVGGAGGPTVGGASQGSYSKPSVSDLRQAIQHAY